MTQRLRNKTAVITGGASGIGLVAAQTFSREGARLILIDRDVDGLKDAVASLQGAGHSVRVMDVVDEGAWRDLAKELSHGEGKLDVLVNNAGIGHYSPIVETSLESWREVCAVNLDSVFLATKHMLPLLAASKRGSIVNTSSIRALNGAPNMASYSASKAAVRSLTRVTAMECTDSNNGVRANSVYPGHIETPLTAIYHLDPEASKKIIANIPIGRIGTPQDIANAMLYLASDDSLFMTGAEMVVDGGQTAR